MAIKSKKIKEDILYIKKLIPENGRSNFDRNLKTLEVNVFEDKKRCTGEYSQRDNYINLSIKGISNMAFRNNYDFFEYMNYSVRYLLLNVASTNFDKDKNILYSGFSTINFSNENSSDINTYLDRGFMSLLLNKDTQEQTLSNNIYYPIAGMLSVIVGMDIMKDAFFNNKGITPMVDKLSWFGINKDEARELFNDINNIEKGFEEKTVNFRLPIVQKKLLSLFSNKAEKIIWSDRDTLTTEKNNFIYFLDYSIQKGSSLLKDLYENPSTYNHETEEIKKLARTI